MLNCGDSILLFGGGRYSSIDSSQLRANDAAHKTSLVGGPGWKPSKRWRRKDAPASTPAHQMRIATAGQDDFAENKRGEWSDNVAATEERFVRSIQSSRGEESRQHYTITHYKGAEAAYTWH